MKLQILLFVFLAQITISAPSLAFFECPVAATSLTRVICFAGGVLGTYFFAGPISGFVDRGLCETDRAVQSMSRALPVFTYNPMLRADRYFSNHREHLPYYLFALSALISTASTLMLHKLAQDAFSNLLMLNDPNSICRLARGGSSFSLQVCSMLLLAPIWLMAAGNTVGCGLVCISPTQS